MLAALRLKLCHLFSASVPHGVREVLTTATGTAPSAPLSLAVVGTGPAGFYFTDRVTKLLGDSVRVDLIDRLPTPFGLVRFGVAPDHADTKNVTRKFSEIAQLPSVRFFGNVNVGSDVSVEELRQAYSAVILATGAAGNRVLGIPGESLPGIISAGAFVSWYNGHPDFTAVAVPPFATVTSAAIVGAGNVALDCARILLKPPSALAATDITRTSLGQLEASAIRDVHILVRRGPLHAQFSGKELREVLGLPNVDIHVTPPTYDASEAALMAAGPAKRKMVQRIYAAQGKHGSGEPRRRLFLHFFRSPVAAHGGLDGQLAAVELQHNTDRGAAAQAAGTTLVASGERSTIPVQLLIKSVGAHGVPLPGVPFDPGRGVVPNEMGRVLITAADSPSAVGAEPVALPGLYVCGWVKRGPRGIIGTNLLDAEETACMLAEDAKLLPAGLTPDALPHLLQERGVQFVSWQQWLKVDDRERELGRVSGCTRQKICHWGELLATARA